VVGIVIVLAAALLLVIGAGVGRRPTEPAMLGAFALLVLGWIMVGVGFYLRRAAARRPRRA
jgi:hypothetical protein